MLRTILQRLVKKDGIYEDEEILKDTVMTTYLGISAISMNSCPSTDPQLRRC